MPEWLEQKLIDELRSLHAEVVREAAGNKGELKRLDQMVRQKVLALGASILQAGLARGAGKGYAGSVLRCRCGGRRRYVTDADKRVTTLVGQVRIRRAYYHCARCKRGWVPLDETLGIEGRSFSSAVQEAACLLGAEVPFERAQDLLERLSAVRMSVEECRHIAEGKGGGLEGQAQEEIGKVWEAKRPIPREAPKAPERLYISPDGTHVPTREQGWTEARVATIFTTRIPPKGQEPERENTRYVAGVEDSEAFYKRLYVEALKQRVDEAREVVVVADGASWIWRRAEIAFPKNRVEILDFYHASEKLWEVGRAVFGEESPKGKKWAERWSRKLEKGSADPVIHALRRLNPRCEEARKRVREVVRYFVTHRRQMRYGDFRRRGYFIGSGATESSCKHLIGARLKQAGMRWDKRQAQAILQLRTARLNDRWEPLWN
jgi:hypothetical protein